MTSKTGVDNLPQWPQALAIYISPSQAEGQPTTFKWKKLKETIWINFLIQILKTS